MSPVTSRSLALWLVPFVAAHLIVACGDVEAPLPGEQTPAATVVDPVANPMDEVEFEEEVLIVPPEAELPATAAARSGLPQVVYVNFDGPVIRNCDNYCSDATTDRSFAIDAHFGKQSIDFAPYTNAAGRQTVLSHLRSAFAPWEVEITTSRPSSGPYTMLVVSTTTSGPAHGVSPLNCGNTNPNDIAFVYKADTVSAQWLAQAAAHELGHSFGLAHVDSEADYMHWAARGASFTVAPRDFARASHVCYSGDVQDAPTLLSEGLARGPKRCDEVDRIAGSDRFSTAATISKAHFSTADTAILTLAADLAPDALAAGPLARSLDAPVLLTSTDALPAPTLTELERLGVSKVIVAGGATAVSNTVVSDLKSRGFVVERIAGASRYETAAMLARRTGAPNGLAFVVSGENNHLVDALAASGPAAALHAPILLVSRDSVPAATAAALSELGVTETILVGGPSSVSEAVETQLPSPTRLAGATRYDTATAVAQEARRRGLSTSRVFIARGDRMPDALAAGATGRVLLLSDPGHLPQSPTWFLQDHGERATLLGGTGALSSAVEQAACGALLY